MREATDLIRESGRIAGLRAQTPNGLLEIRTDLVVAADGRSSILREKAGLEVRHLGAPMDVLWFRLSRRPDDPEQSMGRFAAEQIFIRISRGKYWQCGYVIPKGSIEQIRARGIEAFRSNITLTVRVDRLKRWYREGLLCIGDAAHAMSPVGGINLAIQDAVAAANLLSEALRTKQVTIDHLREVQRRRELPTRVTQRFQVAIQIGSSLACSNAAAYSSPRSLFEYWRDSRYCGEFQRAWSAWAFGPSM